MILKKIGFILLFASLYLFLGCNNGANNDNNDGSVSFFIQNQSPAALVNVVWNGRPFNNRLTISTGSNSQIDNVSKGSSFIFFNIVGIGSDIDLRTEDEVIITDQDYTFIFRNNTSIVEVGNTSRRFIIEGFLNSINNPDGLYLPSHNEILESLNAIGGGINNTRVLSYQLMQNLLWQNVLSGVENDGINLARDSRINIEVGYTGPIPADDVKKALDNLFINFTNANIVVSGGMTFPLPTHLEIQQAIMALDGEGTTSSVMATEYLVNGSFIFDGYEIDRPHGAIIEITVRYTTIILTQAQVRTEVIRIFGVAGFNNVTVNAAHW